MNLSRNKQQEHNRNLYRNWSSEEVKSWPHFMAGFWEGEGCMAFSIIKRDGYKFGIQLIPKVSITQHEDAFFILDWIQLYFGGHGSLWNLKKKPHFWTYQLENRPLIKKYFIPFYEKYLLKRSGKAETFHIFKEILTRMQDNEHFEIEGCKRLVRLAHRMNFNKGSSRKRTLDEILSIIDSKAASSTGYYGMTVPQLVAACKEKGIKGYSNLPKQNLINFLEEYDSK